MNPKSGTAGSAIPPTAPDVADEADNADPGEIEATKARQRAIQAGKYGSAPTTPFKPPEPGDPVKTSWIEIQLVGEDDVPIPGVRYKITLPDGSVDSGSTDSDGVGRAAGFEPGDCQITFPELDQDAWEDA